VDVKPANGNADETSTQSVSIWPLSVQTAV
jgi:hypothetical protein